MAAIHRWKVVLGGALLGAIACATGESPASDTSRLSSATKVASSPPLAGFSADVPAGRLPGVVPATAGATGSASAVAGPGAPGTPAAGPASGTPGVAGPTSSPATAGNSTTGSAPAGSPSRSPTTAVAPGVGNASSTTPAAGVVPSGGAGRSGVATAPGAGATALAPGEISAATGVFTAAQAIRGREVYSTTCERCHMTSAHSGGTFASTWNKRRVFDLYELLSNTMPLDAPGSLTEQQYVDVVAYMLELNGHPAGTKALQADPAALRKIRIDIRSSSAP